MKAASKAATKKKAKGSASLEPRIALALTSKEALGQVEAVLKEGFDGSQKWSYFLDQGPDAALLGTLAKLTPGQASHVAGGTSIAAHVHHLVFSLQASTDWISGIRKEYDWKESWSVSSVSAAGWKTLQESLASCRKRLTSAVRAGGTRSEKEFGGAVGAAVHLAYHLGAIRQKVRALP
jgi:hypothetical protein